MRWLLRYELRKTRQSKWILLGVSLVIEAFFLLGILADDSVMVGMTYLLMFIAAMGGTLYIGLESVLVLHRDLRQEQGYMIFMTPHSRWAIVGAKMLENLISMFFAAGYFIGVMYLDAALIFRTFRTVNSVWVTGTSLLMDSDAFLRSMTGANSFGLDTHVDLQDGTLIICAFVAYVCTWFSFTSTAYLSDTLSVCMLPNRRRLSAALAFGVFILLSYLTMWRQTALPALPDYRESLLMASGLALAQSAGMYVATALLVDRKLSI